ncbi:cell division cycle-associated protein 4 [Choloepus didactylus]|uniref:cell division cycle-associated protein 4 n=1 Tax=Choloepus didactylus TaxID=27675 RepID=UPI00189DFAE4|nr:cell division cycle-associated protein 4 [Choloepus didactylus]XP_037687616.1 cell division cycle-associated protein 4 [Choloepus didactylus]XP_037687617.1 cell division cycle-associated protein 4 [Choloepus didactylus]
MFAAGSKRKCCEPEEGADGALASLRAVPSYALQRQLLLDMSLVKLQLCHMLAEPRLCRSVLIANTVRQIQEEMAQDGTWRLLPPPSVGPAPLDRLVSTDVLCRAAPGPGPEGSGLPGDLEGVQAQEMVSQHSMSAQASRGPQSGAWEVDSPRDSRGHFQKSLDHLLETLDGRAPGSAEDLFADVDSSYRDLDSVLAGVMTGTRPAPCDVLDGLGPPASAAPSASCKPDLGELEHVVGILVES